MTIAPEVSAQILRLHEVERWRVGTIARQLGVHRDTVRRVLAQHSAQPVAAHALRPSRIDPYRPFILQTLGKFPTLSAARLYAMVCERGYQGSGEHFRHVIATLRPRPTCACAPSWVNRRRSTGVPSATSTSAPRVAR